MTSRFKGRDYTTLRNELIEFLRQRLPVDWDYTNLSDPVVIFAETLARIGDQLHFTIDELRRECDMATAQRRSSIYSYALREGYRLMLPKASSGMLSINARELTDDDPIGLNKLHLSIKRFDEIKINTTIASLYAVNDIDADLHVKPSSTYTAQLQELAEQNYASIPNTTEDQRTSITDYVAYNQSEYAKTQHLNVVLGNKGTFNFTYSDINNDSTVELPDPMIDRDLIQLTVTSIDGKETEWQYVNDIIGSGFVGNIYTLTPKFIGGATVLNIEFPTNFKDLFNKTDNFRFDYIKIVDQHLDSTDGIDLTGYLSPSKEYEDVANVDMSMLDLDIGSGVHGYSEYEDPNVTRANYRKLLQDYSSLLTKDDYTNYIKSHYTSNCKVFDHSDNYKENTLPPNTTLQPRVLYILTDSTYEERARLFEDLRERSSRSDCICLIPYGKDPYTIIVKAECFLLGTSVSTISTQIKSKILQYYSDYLGNKVPTISMINHLVHQASDKVATIESVIVRDSTFGSINSDFNLVNTLSNNDIDNLFNAIKSGNTEYTVNNKFPLLEHINIVYPIVRSIPIDDDNFEYRDEYNQVVSSILPVPELDPVDAPTHAYQRFYKDTPDIPDRHIVYINNDSYPTDALGNVISVNYLGQPIGDNGNVLYISDTEQPYNKYPVVTYKAFPPSFPQLSTSRGVVVKEYEDIIKYQLTYSLDSKDWDVSDNDIFDKSTVINNTVAIKSDYIKHHYMMPYLNRVVVLIKAIGN